MAMIRDIQDYLRATRGNMPEPTAPRDEAAPGSAGKESAPPAGSPKAPPADKTAAGNQGSKLAGPLQSGNGDLTDLGVGFIRSRFKRVTEAKNKSVELAHLTDEQIKDHFKNQPGWLEAIVVAQARSDWLGRATKTDFVMSNPRQNFSDVAARLTDAVAAGKTGHAIDNSVLQADVRHFVDGLIQSGDPVMTAAYNACEHHVDPSIRQRWEEFKTSTKKGDMSGFFLGKVGSKQPDIVEVMLSQNEIHVTDATFAYGDPIHNFKSAFYKVAMEHLINVQRVTSTDYRAPLRQTPVGP
jgi:hypothetical protein